MEKIPKKLLTKIFFQIFAHRAPPSGRLYGRGMLRHQLFQILAVQSVGVQTAVVNWRLLVYARWPKVS